MYVKHTPDGNVMLICLYIDDMMLKGNYNTEMSKFKRVLMSAFDMLDMGDMVYFSWD